MTATFTVESIHYGERCTEVTLAMGRVGSGDVGMGVRATLQFSGIEALDSRIPRPGTLVELTIAPAAERTGR